MKATEPSVVLFCKKMPSRPSLGWSRSLDGGIVRKDPDWFPIATRPRTQGEGISALGYPSIRLGTSIS